MITPKKRGASTTIPSSAELDRFRLNVVAELANAPPVGSWPPAHAAMFQDLLAYFLNAVVPGGRRLVAVEDATSHSVAAISELKEWTEAALEGWFLGGRAVIGFSAEDLTRPLLIEFVRDKSGQGTIGAIKGAVDTVFALTVGALLTSAEGARLRRCSDEKCGKYFVRIGKMEHCSTKCGRRVYMREYRRGDHDEPRRRVAKR